MSDAISPDYDLMRQQALGAFNAAQTQLRQRQQDLLSQSGYTYSTDPSGNVQMGGLDVHNPYGAVQQMDFNQGNDLIKNAYQQASRGLGQYGLANQQEKLLRFMQGGQRTDYGRGLFGNLNDYRTQAGDATRTYNDSLNTIASDQAASNAAGQLAAPPVAAPTGNGPNLDISSLIAQLLGTPVPSPTGGFGRYA